MMPVTSHRTSRRGFLRGATIAGGVALFEKTTPGSIGLSSKQGVPQEQPAPRRAHAVVEQVPGRVQPFALQQVRLLPSFWKDTMESNRSFLYSIPNDRLLHNFRVTAGLPSAATPLGGWEAPGCDLRGHYVGHYLSACALLYASTDDEGVRSKANDLVAGLALCQAKDGYLGAYPAHPTYDRLRARQRVWAPFYTYHKILAGLLDMNQLAGNQQALTMATLMADWADQWSAPIPADELQLILMEEHGGISEALFNLYGITGQTRYKDAAIRFEHYAILDPLANNKDILAGNHANTNIPKVIGAARAYELTGEPRYKAISENFHRMVVEHHSYCTGGTSDEEYWFAPDAVSTRLGAKAQECCCVYNMLKLTRHLYSQQPDPVFFDYYERVLLNVRLGTQDPMGMLMYYLPLAPGLYKTFGTPNGAFWCCTGTGSEEYAKLNDSIYFYDADTVYVNLFIPSTLHWEERGLQLEQTTRFPNDETVRLKITTAPTQATALKVRIPAYVEGATLKVNGKARMLPLKPGTYLILSEPWKTGDVVELTLPMKVHIHKAPDDPSVQAAMYGPLALAMLMGTDNLSASMIHGPQGPDVAGRPHVIPDVPGSGVWAKRTQGTAQDPLTFETTGEGNVYSLLPLYRVMDQRYSVYVRPTGGI
jgi:DUF1680 family protein